MERTIQKLLAAQAAGESLSDGDLERLRSREREFIEALNALDRYLGLEPWDGWRFAFLDPIFRGEIISKLDNWNAPQLREIVRLLLIMLQWHDDRGVESGVRWHREYTDKRRQAHLRASLSVRARRAAARRFVDHITAIKTRNPILTDAAAVHSYLRDTNADWLRLTEAERDRRVAAAIKRLGRTRKKTGHEQR